MYFRHTSTGVAAMPDLVWGRWPNLSVLDINGMAVRAVSLQVLRQRSSGVTHLPPMVNLSKAAVFDLFAAECEDLQQLWGCKNKPHNLFVMTQQPQSWQAKTLV